MKLLYLAALIFGSCNSIAHAQWQQQAISSNADFRGLCVVSAKVAWVSGTQGTCGRTTDAGNTWSVGTVPGAAKLDFRDVEAFGENTAYLLSAGLGENSRIYKTTDGGKLWVLQFTNSDPEAFFDAIAFWDDKNGIALSDPVRGHFQLIVTDDGGMNWKRLSEKNLPPALPNEGAFAASGTCLVTYGENDIWFCTGGAKTARVFHSDDRGQSWTVSETPILAGAESAGIFSIAFRDQNRGIIVGGDYRKPNEPGAIAAITTDGGKTWTLIERSFPYRSGVAWARDRWVAVGTSGSDFSQDNGATWKPLDQNNYNSVAFTSTGEGWAVGPSGRVAKFSIAIDDDGRSARPLDVVPHFTTQLGADTQAVSHIDRIVASATEHDDACECVEQERTARYAVDFHCDLCPITCLGEGDVIVARRAAYDQRLARRVPRVGLETDCVLRRGHGHRHRGRVAAASSVARLIDERVAAEVPGRWGVSDDIIGTDNRRAVRRRERSSL